MSEEREIVIEIQLTRWVVGAIVIAAVVVALPAIMAMSDGDAVAGPETRTASRASGMRQFYLGGAAAGSTATTTCAAGYHMASLWEINDPSNLKYNTGLGYTSDDSGDGPPTTTWGWVRTGYVSSDANIPGKANCLGWTSHGLNRYGTTAGLPMTWNNDIQDLGIWDLGAGDCSMAHAVWCIEDL